METDMDDGILKLCWNNHQSTFSQVISTLRDQERLSDATLACNGRMYSVHKLILSICSDYFASMLEGTPCEHPVIVLQDVLPEDLESLLSYMYEGTVSVSQCALGRLIKTAEMLRIKGLAVAETLSSDENFDTNKRERPSSSTCNYMSDTYSPSPKKRRRKSMKRKMEKVTSAEMIPISAGMMPIMAEDVTTFLKSDHDGSDQDLEESTEKNNISTENVEEEKDFLDELHDILTKSSETSENNTGPPLSEPHDDSLGDKLQSPGPSEVKKELEIGEVEIDSKFQIGHIEENNLSLDVDVKTNLGSPSTPGTDGLKYRCCSCTFGSNDATQFILHLRAHQESLDNDKPFRCTYCPYSTSARRNLVAHERTHTGEKPYKCGFCPYTASMPHHVKRHERTHTGEKPYKCALCPYSASQKSSLDNHEKTKHQNRISPNVENFLAALDSQLKQ